MRLNSVELFFLVSATVFSCSNIFAGAELTLNKMINKLVRSKRDTDATSSLYSQSPSDIASSIYQSLFVDILYGRFLRLKMLEPKSLKNDISFIKYSTSHHW